MFWIHSSLWFQFARARIDSIRLCWTQIKSWKGAGAHWRIFPYAVESLDPAVEEQVEIHIKYAGYIERQREEIEQMRRQENTPLPESFDYTVVGGLSNELRSKLEEVRPASIAQASRIQGMTPAAISLLLVHLKKRQLQAKAAS